MSPTWSPIFLALETTTGLEDYAAEMVLQSFQSGLPETLVSIDAALLSGYVLLKFLEADDFGTSNSNHLKKALELFSSQNIPCVLAAYVCVDSMTLEKGTRDHLYQDWRAEDLRKNAETRRVDKRRPWGTRTGPDDREKGRGHHRRDDPLKSTQAEREFLQQCRLMITNSYNNLSKALKIATPVISSYSFRATIKNPQHLVPFPFLTTSRIEADIGEQASVWLDSTEVETIQGWETLCRSVSESAGPSARKPGRLWKVDLKHAEVELVLHLLSVPPSPITRRTHIFQPAPPYSGHSPRSEFPEVIRMILSIRVPRVHCLHGRPGRTALSPSTAHLLVRVLPGFSPFHPLLPTPLLLLDPCSGTGSIGEAMSAAAQADRQTALILSGDILAHNVESALLHGLNQNSTIIEGIVWDAGGSSSGVRSGVIDGIVADLPWGHRECTPKAVARLYPRFLKTFGRVVKPGGHAVMTAASAPLMRRCIANSNLWDIAPVGGEGADGPREVWIGGMRVTVFLLRRVDC